MVTLAVIAVLADGITTYRAIRRGAREKNPIRGFLIDKLGLLGGTVGVSAGVALIFALLIAISLTSYISLANNSLKQASRSFYASSGMNLAETGLELAGVCFNHLDGASPGEPPAAGARPPTPAHPRGAR